MLRQRAGRAVSIPLIVASFVWIAAGSASAQVLVASDDRFGVPLGSPLVVEPFGVLDNDTLDGENAGEGGAAAELVTDASHGTLTLASDGSFSYSPGASFDGTDTFVYRARFGTASSTATVTLSACQGGPLVFSCWKEGAYLATGWGLGLFEFREGFEDDAVWGSVRNPSSAASISSRGIRWQSNHPDPPASNTLTTGAGAAWTGQWGVYDPEHGYAETPSLSCDNNENPPPGCFYHDGVTGIRETGFEALHGAGGHFRGIYSAKVVVILDGDEANPVALGQLGTGDQFLGVIDASPAGFTRFEFRETEGRAGNALYVWADAFVFFVETAKAAAIPTLSPSGVFVLLASLAMLGLAGLRRRGG